MRISIVCFLSSAILNASFVKILRFMYSDLQMYGIHDDNDDMTQTISALRMTSLFHSRRGKTLLRFSAPAALDSARAANNPLGLILA